MRKNLGTSASVITLAAALLLHVNNSRSEKPEAPATSVNTTLADAVSSTSAIPLSATDADAEGLGHVLHTEPGSHVCKPVPSDSNSPSSACLPMVDSKLEDLESCGLSPACRAQYRAHLGFKDAHLQFMLASVPDPQQTRLALFTDTVINALQQAAFDAHWELATQWLPWRPPSKASTPVSGRGTGYLRHPGLLVFRHSPVKKKFDAGVLLVFIVGESPISGLNLEQFRMARAYMRALGSPEIVRLVTPCFSGSIASLTAALETDRHIPSANSSRYRIRSGTATSRMLLHAFQRAKDVDIHGTSLNNVDEEAGFQKVLESLGIPVNHAAILIEDESAYAKDLAETAAPQALPASAHPLVLRYPRDISNLRNQYRETVNSSTSDKSPASVNLSLKDPDAGEDTLPIFSTDRTPVEQDAMLSRTVAQIQRDHIKLVKVSATNILDLLFLAKVLRVHCPDTRVLVTSPDLLFVKASQQSSLTGVLALSTYPVFSSATHWLGENPLTYSNANEEGTYFAAKLLLLAPGEDPALDGYAWNGQPYPASWLMVLDREGFAPLRLMKNGNADWFEPRTSSRKASFVLPSPPASWLLWVTLLSVLSCAICAWIIYLHSNNKVQAWSILAPDGRHIADAHRLLCIVSVLLMLATMQAILLAPLGSKCFTWPYLAPTLCPFFPLGISCWLVRQILEKPRPSIARIVTVGFVFLVPVLIVLDWLVCCSRAEEGIGFFFSFRSLELQAGSSPALPILFLLAALLVFAVAHLVRFYFAINHRPRMFVTGIDRFFSFKMRNCRRDLNRVLVAPMNLSPRRQLVLGAWFLFAVVFVLAVWRARQKLSSFEGSEYDALLISLLTLVLLALILTAQQMRLSWASLQPLLARLNTLPFRSSFPQISDIGRSGPIWVKRLNLQSLAMPTDASNLLRNLELLSCQPNWDYTLTCESLRSGRQRYGLVVSWLLENGATTTRAAKRDLFCTLRYLGAMLCHVVIQRILVRDWERRSLPTEALGNLRTDKQPVSSPPDAYVTAQAFVALQLSAFINYGVRQIQNLAFAISIAFGLLVIALNTYSPQAPQAVNRFLFAAFAILGYLLWTVLSQMERDPILSQLSGTEEGELNKSFYLKLIAYGAIPVLGLLSSQFPYLGDFVSSWLQPSLEALR